MVAGGEAKNGAGIYSPAEIAPHRDIRAEANPDGFLKGMTELLRIFGIRPRRRGIDRLRIIKIPVPAQLHSFFGSDHVMAGRDLENALKQRPRLMPAKSYPVIKRLAIPTGGYSSEIGRASCSERG